MVIFGIFHFVSGQDMTATLAGWPMALFFVYLSGAGLLLGGLAIIINRYARLAGFLLALEIGLITLSIQLPGILAGGEGAQMAILLALHNIALIGAALVIASQSSNRGLQEK